MAAPRPILRDRAGDERPYPGLAERDAAYRRALQLMTLRPAALMDLVGRGLRREEAVQVGLRSLAQRGNEHQAVMSTMRAEFGDRFLLSCPGFHDKNGRLGMLTASGDRDGYVIPYRAEDGRITGWQAKILGNSYLTPAGMRVAHTYAVAGTGGPGADLYVTEGGLKAIVASALGEVWCLGLIGQALQPEHIAIVARLQPGRVIVALDRETNANTDKARKHWLTALAEAGFETYDGVWDGLT